MSDIYFSEFFVSGYREILWYIVRGLYRTHAKSGFFIMPPSQIIFNKKITINEKFYSYSTYLSRIF